MFKLNGRLKKDRYSASGAVERSVHSAFTASLDIIEGAKFWFFPSFLLFPDLISIRYLDPEGIEIRSLYSWIQLAILFELELYRILVSLSAFRSGNYFRQNRPT
jgi:hypothetical protein